MEFKKRSKGVRHLLVWSVSDVLDSQLRVYLPRRGLSPQRESGSLSTSYHFTSEIPTAWQHISLVWISPVPVPQEEINLFLEQVTVALESWVLLLCLPHHSGHIYTVYTYSCSDGLLSFVLISRVLREGTCGFQCSPWELSQVQQKTTGEVCFECTETGTLKNINPEYVYFGYSDRLTLIIFCPLNWSNTNGTFTHNGLLLCSFS